MNYIHTVSILIYIILYGFSLNTTCNQIKASISYGELVDKITILTIKTERISDQKKLNNIIVELRNLLELFNEYIGPRDDVLLLMKKLKKINEKLWDVEDALRKKERLKEFDREFIALSRKVYETNDKRCAIKKQIDMLFNSYITEEKSYESYA